MIEFANWLADSSASQSLQQMYWIVPVAQCIHILAISTLMGSALMINLRILNMAGREQTVTSTARRFIPWIWWGFVVALVTGLVQIVAEPVRDLVNLAFWGKMSLLFISLLLLAFFQSTLVRSVAIWEETPSGRSWAQVLAVLSILMWVAIVILGRWIAYAQIEVNQ